MKRLKPTQKLRITSGVVHLNTTVSKVRAGLGDSYAFNAATQKAVDALEYNLGVDKGIVQVGISGIWENIPVQIDMVL